MIVTGARSALDYLMEPLMRSFDRAFRESRGAHEPRVRA